MAEDESEAVVESRSGAQCAVVFRSLKSDGDGKFSFAVGYGSRRRHAESDDGRHCGDFQQLTAWLKFRGLELSIARMYQCMYTVFCAVWLALYLSERNTHLDYQAVWKHPNPVRLCLVVWKHSLGLSLQRAARVQRKIFRFLSSRGFFSVKVRTIRVCT